MPVRISALTAPAFLRSLNLPSRVAVLTASLPACLPHVVCPPTCNTLCVCVCVCVACIFECNVFKFSVVVQRGVHACEWANEYEYECECECMCECRWVWVWWVQTVNELLKWEFLGFIVTLKTCQLTFAFRSRSRSWSLSSGCSIRWPLK